MLHCCFFQLAECKKLKNKLNSCQHFLLGPSYLETIESQIDYFLKVMFDACFTGRDEAVQSRTVE